MTRPGVFILGFLLMLSGFSGSRTHAQENPVSGHVTEYETGSPLPGISVMIKGTTEGTITDLEGFYQLEVLPGAELLFSFPGYRTEVRAAGDQSVIDVRMQAEDTPFSEVVTIGYGALSRKETTVAVTGIQEEDFNRGNINDVLQLIQGRVAGLSISRPGSNPNEAFTVRLRGISTIGANAEPLVVVDGIIGGTLENVDPMDVESIDVLKDGSAAAIYGTRGSSGVILVNTKRGTPGTFRISYQGYLALDNTSRYPDFMDASEWRRLSGAIGTGVDYQNETNWMEQITQTAFTQAHGVSASGGNRQTTYRASINFRDIDGIMINTGRQQLNARFNLEQKALNEKLSATIGFAGTYYKRKPGWDPANRYAAIYNPTAPVKIDASTPLPPGLNPEDFERWDGYFNEIRFDYYNPVQILEENFNDEEDTRINLSGRLAYEIIDGLVVDGFYAFQSVSDLAGRYYSKNSYWIGGNFNGLARRQYDAQQNQLFELTGRWEGNIGSASGLKAIIGYSYQDFLNEGYAAEGGNIMSNAFTYNNLGAAKDFDDGLGSVESYKNSSKLAAFFGRIHFDFKDLWFVSFSLRQEGASRFGENNKWGTFPAAGTGVELGGLIHSGVIDNLKFRISYGLTGNLPPEDYISLYKFDRIGNVIYNGRYIPSYGLVSNTNPDLGWERKGEFDVGLDFSLFGSRLYGSLDWYTRTTKDLILEYWVPVPPNLYPTTYNNVGELQNRGLELSLSGRPVDRNNFQFSTSLVLSWYLRNEITSLSDRSRGLEYGVNYTGYPGSPGGAQPVIRIEEGHPIGQIYGYLFEGIDENGEAIYKDLNYNDYPDEGDRAVIGSGIPDLELGWGNRINIGRNWDVNLFFRGAIGHDLANMFRFFYEVPAWIGNYNLTRSSLTLRNNTTGAYLNTYSRFSDFQTEKASFFKLDNFSIGYSIPFREESAIRTLRLYLAGNNTFTITGYSGTDPEVRWEDDQSDPSALAPGIDRRNTWYPARSWSIGLQLEL